MKNKNRFEKLLKPVDKLEFNNIDDNSSEIDDVFEEFHKDSYLKKRRNSNNNYLSKYEADIKTFEGFSDDFKSTMFKLRTELKVFIRLPSIYVVLTKFVH